MKIILPKSDLSLRDTVLCRRNYKGAHLDYLDFKIEDSLAEIFKIELELTEKSNFYIEEITSCKDFNLYETFSCIDSYKTGIIEQNGVILFLSKNGIVPKKEKIDLLLKRLDKDNDNKVSFDDFKCLFMIPSKGYKSNQSDTYLNGSVNNYYLENGKRSESYLKDSRNDLSQEKHKNKKNLVLHKDYKTNNINLESDEIPYSTMSNFTQGSNYNYNTDEEALSPTSTNSNFKLSGMTNYSSFRLTRRDPNFSINTLRPEHNEKPFKIYIQNCHSYGNKNEFERDNEFVSTISSNNKDSQNIVKSMVSLDQLNTNIINSSRKNLFLQAKSDSYTYLSNKRLETNNTLTNKIKNENLEDTKLQMVNQASEKSNLNPSKSNNIDINNTLQINNNLSQIKTNISTSQGETISTNAETEYINYFAMFIKDILIMYNKLEKIREVVNIDTNIYLDDLFKYFDKNNDMIINIKEFKESLDSLDVKVNFEELKLIFKRYDLEQNLSIK